MAKITINKDSFKTARLSSSDNKIVCIEPMRNKDYQLIIKPSQSKRNCHKVKVYNVPHKNEMCMAFCFERGEKAYFPAIKDDDFKLKAFDMNNGEQMLEEKYLFQWYGRNDRNSDYGILKSVAEPEKFLSIDNDKVTLKSEAKFEFQIKYEPELSQQRVQEEVKDYSLNRVICQTRRMSQRLMRRSRN